MKKLHIITFICFLAGITTFAQENLFYKSYTWENIPDFKLPAENEEDILELKSRVVIEYAFEGDQFTEYFLEHRILWLNSDAAIEEYNKIYLPHSSTSQLEVNKARVISKDG